MPLLVPVAHQKGGVGKSSLSINLAAYFTLEGISCAVVDADVQGSITTLVNAFGENNKYGAVNLIPRNAFKSFSDLKNIEDYQILLIDTPPYLSTNLTEIFQISDYVLVPTKPAVFDMFAIEGTIQMIQEAQALNPNLKTGVVINMSNAHSTHNSEIRKVIEDKGVYCFKTEVRKRVEFERCLGYHDSIFSTSDEKAKGEIRALGNELFDRLEQ